MKRRNGRHCPHVDVVGIYGDEINMVGGYRNLCRDCGRYLDGPASISVDRQRLIAAPSPDEQPARPTYTLTADLDSLEYAIADYVAKWGEHLTGKPYMGESGPNIGGLPTSVANMAMTVVRKNLLSPSPDEDTRREVPDVLLTFAKWADWYLEGGCRRDHHGYCQSHGLDKDCPVGQMREWLAAHGGPNAG